MATGKISELVDDSAIAQLEQLYQKLGITTQAMVAGTDAAAGYIAAISKVNTISEFNAVNQQTATVMGEVKQAQQNVITVQKEAVTATNQVVEATKANMVAGADASVILQKLGGAYDDSIRLLVAQKIELAQVTTQLKEQAKAMGDNVAYQAKGIDYTAKLTQQQLLLKEAIAQNNLVIKQQVKEQLAAETSNNIYMAQLNQMIKLQNALSAEERESTVYGRELQAQITATRAAVVAANEAQGKFNDNVGNYPGKANEAVVATEKTGKAFDVTGRLANVLTSRIFRMAASFLLITVALGAIEWLYKWISNLDIFTGRLDQATQNLKALNAVQKDVAQSGGEIVGKFRILSDTVKDLSIAYEDRLRAASELKKLFPEELEHSTAQAIANGEEKDSLDKLTDSVIKLAKAKAAATEIEKQEGQIIDLQIQRDKVNSAKESQTLNEVRKDKANYEASLQYTQQQYGRPKLTQKQLDDAFAAQNPLKNSLVRGFKQQADEANKDIAAQIAIKENTIKYLEQYGGLKNEAESIEGKPTKTPKDKTNEDDIANAKAHLELVKSIAKETLDNEKLSYEQRLAALKVFTEASNALINLELGAKNRKATTATERDTNNTEADTQRLGVKSFDKMETDKLAKQQLDAARKKLEDTLKLEKDFADKVLAVSQEATDKQLDLIDKERNKEETTLVKKYTKGLIDEKKYREALLKIADQYDIDRLGAIAFQEQTKLEILQAKENNDVGFAKGNGASANQLNDIRAKSGVSQQQGVVDKAGITLQNAQNKQTLDSGSQSGKDRAAEEQAAVQDLQQVQDDASKIIQDNYQSEINLLERRKQLIQDTADDEIQRVGNSILSSKEKAREEAVIREQSKQQQLQVDAQIAKVKEEAAKSQKAFNEVSILENTAVAISKTLAETGIFGVATVPIIAALGAAQLAVVLSQPIPKFEKGGTVKRDGAIMTGEAGTELRIDPSGAMSLTESRANITYAKAGTQIISNRELMNIVGKPEPVYYASNTAVDTRKMEKLLKENNELQKRTKRPIVNINSDRFGSYSRDRNY